jgi:hypothetical protein
MDREPIGTGRLPALGGLPRRHFLKLYREHPRKRGQCPKRLDGQARVLRPMIKLIGADIPKRKISNCEAVHIPHGVIVISLILSSSWWAQ